MRYFAPLESMDLKAAMAQLFSELLLLLPLLHAANCSRRLPDGSSLAQLTSAQAVALAPK
jgi:hypothetical protein